MEIIKRFDTSIACLVNDLLDVWHAEAGLLVIELAELDLQKFINEVEETTVGFTSLKTDPQSKITAIALWIWSR